MQGNPIVEEGDVVVAYTREDTLMLDIDEQLESRVVNFGQRYSKCYKHLGGYIILETSKTPKVDLFGNRFGNYCVIFGKHLKWEEIVWHIEECRGMGIINEDFARIRMFGSITIRVNPKNDKKPALKVIHSNYGEDDEAIESFLEYYEMNKDLGTSAKKGANRK